MSYVITLQLHVFMCTLALTYELSGHHLHCHRVEVVQCQSWSTCLERERGGVERVEVEGGGGGGGGGGGRGGGGRGGEEKGQGVRKRGDGMVKNPYNVIACTALQGLRWVHTIHTSHKSHTPLYTPV